MTVVYSLENVVKERLIDGSGFRLVVPRIQIRAEENIALIGHSGCGKSTLLDMLALILRPDEARQWAALGLGLLVLALLVELWIGGRLARRMAYVAAGLALLLSLPWIRHGLSDPSDRLLVVRAPSVALRSASRLSSLWKNRARSARTSRCSSICSSGMSRP